MALFPLGALAQALEERKRKEQQQPVVVNIDLSGLAAALSRTELKTREARGVTPAPG